MRYNYTTEQMKLDLQAADLANHATRAELAADGWYCGDPNALPSKIGSAAGLGTPDGFTFTGTKPNCMMIVRYRDGGQGGVWRTPSQRQSYRDAIQAIQRRYAQGYQGHAEAVAMRCRCAVARVARRAA